MANTTKGNRQVLKFLYLSFKKKKKNSDYEKKLTKIEK